MVVELWRIGPGCASKKAKLDPSLADINHGARGGCQRLLLPIAVTGADLKPIVGEQGFHLLGKDIAQGPTILLLLLETFWREPVFLEGVVLNLRDRIVLLMLTDHILPSVRHGVRLWFRKASFKETAWRGMACSKEKTSLWMHTCPHACQQRFLVRSGQKLLKSVS